MDIGFQEILLISVIALVILGPERLPTAIKTVAIWVGRLRRSFNDIRYAIEQEINTDEIRQQIHNENVLHKLGETRDTLNQLEEQLQQDLHTPADSTTNITAASTTTENSANTDSDEEPPKTNT